MRPTKLVISAFGPYADRTVIDLDKLGRSGLYLIAGNTGAGKTTIFDAISYALFGHASGDNRDDSKLFRCLNAEPGTKTEVDLTFEYAGREYRIVRSPEQMRPKTRGEGMTKESASVAFYRPDESGKQGPASRPVCKEKEVSAAVQEIVGVDRNQFAQIAMIAQGDFLKLLLASTDERKKIFRRIFKTDKFALLQEELRKRASEIEGQCGERERVACAMVARVSCGEKSPLAADVDGVKQLAAENRVSKWEEVCSLLAAVVDEDSSAVEATKMSLDEYASRLAAMDRELGTARGVEKAREALDEARKQHAELMANLKPLAAAVADVEARKPECEKLQEEIAALNERLPEYGELEADRLSIETKSAELATARNAFGEGTKAFDALDENIRNLETEFAGLSDAGEKRAQAEARINVLEERRRQLRSAADMVKELDEAETALTAAQDEYRKADGEYRRSNAECEAKNRAFLDEQAGILAEALEDGCACPVCGSTTHPHKAHKSVDAPTQAALEELKGNVAVLLDAWNAKAGIASTAKATRDAKREELEKKLVELFGECSVGEAKARIRTEFDDVKAQLEKLNLEFKEEAKREERGMALEKSLPGLKANLEKLRGENINASNGISALEAELAALDRKASELEGKLPHKSKVDAEADIAAKRADLAGMRETIEKANADFAACKEQTAVLEGQVKSLEEQLQGTPRYNLEEMENARSATFAEQQKLSQTWQAVSARCVENARSLKEIRGAAGELGDLFNKHKWIANLSATANGKLSGASKVMLETYVQTSYFDRIVSRANIRFRRLSNGQYELVRRVEASNNKGQSGLDLNVLDHASGKEREVETLSGGESFLASLSLALGLADEVQSSAGGVQLDSMFVDEGFGSLDDETLRTAVDTLQTLAGENRLVGVISHVSELERRIEKIVRVRKDEDKGSVVTIEV